MRSPEHVPPATDERGRALDAGLADLRARYRAWQARPAPQCVFIVGTGRSGTHLLAQALGMSPQAHVLLEKQPLFRWSTLMASDPRQEEALFSRWVRRFRLEQFAAAPRIVVDKSHPNIWVAERLAAAFPAGLFLGMRRSPHATVASMLKHGGFAWDERRWRPLPLPNRFLGIDGMPADAYAALSRPEQFTLRWISNERKFAAVRRALGTRLLEVDYERMVLDTVASLERIFAFLGLERPLAAPAIKDEGLDKWRRDLSADDVAAIDALLTRHGFAAARSDAGGGGK